MKTFVRVAEIWVPDAQGELLEFGGGLYATAPEFGALSQAMCFGRGEGLPGRVWEERRPVVMKDLQAGHFQRAAAAKAAGLACAVAFPVYVEERLQAVVVLFCGDDAGQSGAIEVWRNDPRVSTELTLQDGVYGAADAAFEQASRDATMPRGVGLPGLAWQRQGAVVMDGLTESTQFVRGEAARATELRSGLAMPCPVPGDDNLVLAFLSAPHTPIATRIECWTAGADGQSLALAQRADWAAAGSALDETPDPAILEAFATGVPRVGESVIALPISADGLVTEAVALYFQA